MEFRFYALGNEATLDMVGQIEATGPFAEIKFEVERHFDHVIAAAEARQVLVLSSSLGKTRGHIVAIEAVYLAHLSGKVKPEQQARMLNWLVEENVPKQR
jgi:hypothetical protein